MCVESLDGLSHRARCRSQTSAVKLRVPCWGHMMRYRGFQLTLEPWFIVCVYAKPDYIVVLIGALSDKRQDNCSNAQPALVA